MVEWKALRFYKHYPVLQPGESHHYYLHYMVSQNTPNPLRLFAEAFGRRPYDKGISMWWVKPRVEAFDRHKVEIKSGMVME